MKKLGKIVCLVLAVLVLAASVPMTVSAAGATVEMIDGIRTVFISNFGRVSYDGEAHTGFKTFEEGFAALGKDGGKIVFTGSLDMNAFQDIKGRGNVKFEGVGTKITGSVLDFKNAETIEFLGDTEFDNCVILTGENIPIHTNGYSIRSTNAFSSYTVERYSASGNTLEYPHPYIFSAGNITKDSPSSETVICGGVGYAIVGGSYGTDKTVGETHLTLGNSGDRKTEYTAVYAGNYESTGSFEGTSYVTIDGAEVEKAVVGSNSGTTNANLVFTLKRGTLLKLIVGSENDAKVNGNVVIRLGENGPIEIDCSNRKTVSGKVIFIDSLGHVDTDVVDFDYYIKSEGSTVEPVFNGTVLSGFRVSDKNGFIPSKVFINGKETAGKDGIYEIPEGKSTVTCESSASVVVNKNASYVAGYEDGTFAPQKNITRAEAITLLARIICEDISKLPEIASCSYTDVNKSDWFCGTVAFFEKLGYLSKLEVESGKKILPQQNITRAEFAELSVHVLSEIYDGREFGVKTFPDVDLSNKYYSAIGQLGYLGIINGYEDGTFAPGKNITRAEVVTIVNKFLGRAPTGEKGATTFKDIGGHWAEAQIITACNPQKSGDKTVWTLTDDITKGNYKLLEGDGVTVGDQIKALRESFSKNSLKDNVEGIDMISKWQIDKILAAKDVDPADYGTVYYVSEKNGNDENDGLSPEKPFKTLGALGNSRISFKMKKGDAVLFERGGTYRGTLPCAAGVTYAAYGTGAKPVISGSRKNYADPSLWEKTDVDGVYKCKDYLSNVGIIAYDFTGILGNYHENIGFLQVAGARGFTGYKDLVKDGTFYSDLATSELYVCSKAGNPGSRYKSIEIGAGGNLTTVASPGYVTFDNLTMRFTGAHAIGVGGHKEIRVQNCTFDYLGGSILRGFNGGNTTRYGNALQVYGSCDGWYLHNNWIYQIYDTGITHQYNSYDSKGSCIMDHVEYVGNVVEYCHWSIEYYNPDYDKTKHTFNNTYIADNICRMNGYGWGSQIRMTGSTLFQSANITKNTENFVAENNIFDRSAGKIFNCNSEGDRKLELRNNIYVQDTNGIIGNFFGNVITATDTAAKRLANAAKDTTAIIIQNNDKSINDYLRN